MKAEGFEAEYGLLGQSLILKHDGVSSQVFPLNLSDHKVKVAVDQHTIGFEELCQPEAGEEGFILGLIISCFELESECLFNFEAARAR